VRTKHLGVMMLIATLAIVEFSYFKDHSLSNGAPPPGTNTGIVAAKQLTGPGAAPEPPPPPFDVRPLLRPAKKYFGLALSGDPTDPAAVQKVTARVGKQPNLLAIYESFGDGFAASEVREAYLHGAMAIIRWEPFGTTLADVAAGKQDAYVTKFATAVRTLNLPIVLTFAHEMNGGWYPWGASKAPAADFVAAWRHVHDVFAKVGATNVIWTWTANVINPIPSVKLEPRYPGDQYVDWLGIDGYFTRRGAHTYEELFGPTVRSMRKFSAKPILIVETGVASGVNRPAWITDLITGMAGDKDMLGFVYFDQNGSGQWKVDDDDRTLSAFRKAITTKTIGFEVQ